MIIKKKYLLLTFILIIIIQTLIYTNNQQRTSLRFFKWTVQEVILGRLISISFFSGLFISTLLTNTINSNKSDKFENIEQNYERLNDEEDIESNVEMPPQRDIRDAQPTISVNYRVIKKSEENNLKSNKNYSNNIYEKDDWEKDDNEW